MLVKIRTCIPVGVSRRDKPGGSYASGFLASWNVYDQLLLRPSVMAMLEEIRVLDSDGEQSLLTAKNLPDDNAGSDHLPLIE